MRITASKNDVILWHIWEYFGTRAITEYFQVLTSIKKY